METTLAAVDAVDMGLAWGLQLGPHEEEVRVRIVEHSAGEMGCRSLTWQMS